MVIADGEVADEEQAHAGEAKDHCDKVFEMEFFADHERCQYQDVNGCGVLEKDRVGGGGVFGRPHEQEKQRRVDHAAHDAESVDPQAVFASNDENRDAGQQRAEEGHLVGVEVCRELDKHPAGAPEQDGEDDVVDGIQRFSFGHGDILSHKADLNAENAKAAEKEWKKSLRSLRSLR